MPISSLPNDILLNIIFLCTDADWDEKLDGYIDIPALHWDWIATTHVCRRWRNLALSSPFLWYKPTLERHSRERLEAYFERSRNTPLTISPFSSCGPMNSGSGGCERCRDNMVAALGHLHRIRHLNILFVDHGILEVMLDKTAPLLESLEMTPLYPDVGDTPVLLNDAFLASCGPSLKRLVLKGFYFPYDLDVLRGLVCLKILDCFGFYPDHRRYKIMSPCFPTIHELIGLLASSPTLRELRLYALRKSADSDRRNYKKIEMPHLNAFEIQEMALLTCEDLIQYVSIPDQSELILGVRYTAVSEYPRILSILRHISKNKQANTLHLALMGSRACGDVNAKRDMISQDDTGSARTSLSLFQVNQGDVRLDDHELDVGDVFEMMVKLVRNSYWKDVTGLHLTVSICYTLDENRWRTLLASFECVEDLKLTVDNMGSLYGPQADVGKFVLLESTIISSLELPSDPAIEGSAMVLPHLTKLFLRITAIVHVSDLLLQCMRVRKERGFAISTLRIDALRKYRPHEVGDDWHTEMKRHVDHLTCFGSLDDWIWTENPHLISNPFV